MCNFLTVAKKVCELTDWSITNLKLQKMMYILQMVYMGNNNGERLFNATFEAWDYGPVIPDLYKKMKIFGAGIIENYSLLFDVKEEKEISEEKLDFLRRNVLSLNKLTGAQLVSLTHRKGSAWDKNYRGLEISDNDMIEEFERFWKPVNV